MKAHLFDEVYCNFYENLELVLQGKYRIFTEVQLDSFIRVEEHDLLLRGKRIQFLICERDEMTAFCGIQLKGAGASFSQYSDFLKDVFQSVGIPLIEFPLVNNISQAEIRESVDNLLLRTASPGNCPKCGHQMQMRTAVKGRNEGKCFWVCMNFPSCKGVIRI